MRTLSSALIAAQKSVSAEPYVDVIVENSVGGVRRLDFAQIDATSHTIAKHDVAVAGDSSVTRVRMESGAVKQQRVTNPASGPWNIWNNLATGMGTQIACVAKGARVAVVYSDAAGTGIKLRESTDSGATYAAEVAVTTAGGALGDVSITYKNSSGDLAIAWAAGTSISIIKRTSGSFGSVSSTSPGFSTLNGIAMVYGFDWDIAVAGVEVTTLKPSLWTVVYGDGNDVAANTWGALQAQTQAESDAQVTYKAPSITFTDTYRINFVEADAFTGGSTRVYRTWLNPATTFVAGAFTLRTPVPVNYGGAEGLALAADAGGSGYVYETAPDAVYRAPQSQTLLSLTGDVLAIEIDERSESTRGHIDIDNSSAIYAGPPSPLAIGSLVAVSWGYRTSSGLQASRMPDLWIAGIEHRRVSGARAGGVSVLRLHVEGAWELLRRNVQRAQITHTTDTYFAVLTRIFSRAGLQLTASSASTRATTVTPKFTIASGMSGYEAAQAALAFLADRIRLKPLAAASILEPLTSSSSAYTFGTDHPLREARVLLEGPPVSEVQAFGAAAFGEAIDYANAALGIGTRTQQRDLTSSTGSAAAATAVAHLRQRALDAEAGRITIPPHVGLELLDVIDFIDALISSTAIKRRVAAIRWRLDRVKALYEQQIDLGAM